MNEHLYTVSVQDKKTNEKLKLQVWARNTDEATHKLTGGLYTFIQTGWAGTGSTGLLRSVLQGM